MDKLSKLIDNVISLIDIQQWIWLIGFYFQVHDAYPDVYLNVTKDNKLLGYVKIDIKDFIFSQSEDAKGLKCGKVSSLFLKSTNCIHSCWNCGCVFGKFDVLLWIGSDKELHEWLPQNAVEVSTNKINFMYERYFTCKVYVHQTKIRPGADKSGLCDPKLNVFYDGSWEKTKVIKRFEASFE